MTLHPSADWPAARSALRAAPRPAVEPLEPRRLFAVELISAAVAAGATGDGASPSDVPIGTLVPSAEVSDDGRYVVFRTGAADLVAGVPAGPGFRNDIVVRDRVTATTRLVSVRADGQPASDARSPTISGDGRYVAFTSDDAALVPGDANASQDVFVRDLVTNTTQLASRTPAGVSGSDQSYAAQISRNGRYVTFFSHAGNLPGAPPNIGLNFPGLFRFDLQTGAVAFVADPQALNAIGMKHQLSDDGEVIAYNLFTEETVEVRVKNMVTGADTLASATTAGQAAAMTSHDWFELSGDGRRLGFVTDTRATPNDVNDAQDVFVRDLAAGTTVLASVSADGNSFPADTARGSDMAFGGRSVSNDGRFVLIESQDSLTGVPDRGSGENNFSDVFVRDLLTNTTRLLSVDPPAADPQDPEPQDAYFGALSADGRYVAFMSDFPFQGANPTQLIVVDLSTGVETVVSATPSGGLYNLGEGVGGGLVFSRTGSVLLFVGESPAGELLPGVTDTNAGDDLFAYSLSASALDQQPPTVVVPPMLSITTAGATPYDFSVVYIDDVAMDAATVGNGDVVVTGPNNYRQPALLVGATPAAGGSQLNATYRVAAPGGVFDAAANGTYQVEFVADEVRDAAGNALAAGTVAGAVFGVNIVAPDAPDLQAASLQGAVPASVVAGAKQKVKPLALTVTNSGTQPADGTVTIRLVASTDAVADAGDAVVSELPNQKVKLAPGKSKTFRLKAGAFPAVPDGDYRLLAVVDAGGALAERLESNNAAALAGVVRIAAPFSDIGVASPTLSGRLAPGKKATLLLTARNEGNTAAKGVQSARVRLTADPANPAAASRTFDVPLKLSLKPGATRALRAKLTLPGDLPPGAYFLVVELLPGAPWNDPDATDNAATGAATYAVG